MTQLTGSVGRDGKNAAVDVILTQRLLNGSMQFLIPLAPLPEDGAASASLVEAIRTFQERLLKPAKPDGRIDPGGSTWFKLVHVSSFHPRPAHVQAFLDMASPAARRVQAKWKVPASVLLAQAAQESGWGTRVKGNAYFGIKGSSGTSGGIAFATREVVNGTSINITDTFRAYQTFEDAADGYGRFLNENANYKAAFQYTNNPLRFVEEVAKGGYATDPQYASSVKQIITGFHLTEYDQ